MKKSCILLMLFCAAAAFGETPAASDKAAPKTHKSKRAASKKKNASAAPSSAPLTIPKEAVLDPKDGTYRYTDKNGRKWVYMNGPMGPSRWEDKGGAASGIETDNRLSHDPNVRAIDQGDTVKFTRATPFGDQSWTKKKSELTEDERAVVANAPKSVDQTRDSK